MAVACRPGEAASGDWPGPAHACLAGFFPLRSWLAGVALSKQEVGAVWPFTGDVKPTSGLGGKPSLDSFLVSPVSFLRH